jgi:serine kinase of HPr protein (carbohydrate metabolism regulator)
MRNIHATCLVIADRGVLITGASGTGKTALALRLIQSARRAGMFARLVADDQLLVSDVDGRIVCRAPASISGLAEMRGVGIVETECEPAAVAHLRVNLLPAAEIARMPEHGESRFDFGNSSILSVDLPGNRTCENEITAFQLAFGRKNAADNTLA